jgi:hypothetical protein
MEVSLNFFSKKKRSIISVVLFLISSNSLALDLKGVYLSSCKREVGVIVDSETSNLTMFTVQGETVVIPRYEIIGISSYPIEKFPSKAIKVNKEIRPFQFKTKYKKEIVPLVNGWPIAFSKNKISVLSIDGKEVPFSRNSIWDIEKKKKHKNNYNFSNILKSRLHFLHPVGLRKCKNTLVGSGDKVVEIAPQEFISNPIEIKRRLDSFKREKAQLEAYLLSKDFYAIPEVYTNRTTLGIWFSANSRYGESENRANNWAPILENEFSSGPYGYQHTFLTGASPNMYFVHAEPQTQFFYRFKADYFHLAFFQDPTLILLGNKYRWFPDDIGKTEYRVNDTSFIELGFDYSSFSFLAQLSSEMQVGYKDESDIFFDGSLTVPKFGLEFRNYKFRTNFLIGSADENVRSDSFNNNSSFRISEFSFHFFRINYLQDLSDKWSLQLSYISHKLTVEDIQNTNSIYSALGEYRYSYKYVFKSFITYEDSRLNDRDIKFFKIGFNANLIF